MTARSVYELVDERFGITTSSLTNREVDEVQSTVTLIAKRDPSRLGITVMNLAVSNNIYVHPSPEVSTTRGFKLTPGGSLTSDMAFDFALPAEEWWAIGDDDDMSVMVLEVVATP